MKRSVFWVVVLTLISALVIAPGLFSQIKQDPASKLDRIDGYVQSIDKKTMTIVIRQQGTGNLDYHVVYNADTAFTFRNTKSTLDEVKIDRRVICLGKADGATKLNATRIDIREK